MINTKLQNIIDTKSAIGNAIVNKGGTITSETPFFNYAAQIDGISTGTPQTIFAASDGSKWALTNAVNLVNDAGNVTSDFNYWQPANNSTSDPILNIGTVGANISGNIQLVPVNQVNIAQYVNIVINDTDGGKYVGYNGYDEITNPTPTGNVVFNRWVLNNSASGTVIFANTTIVSSGTFNGPNTTQTANITNLAFIGNTNNYGGSVYSVKTNNGFIYAAGEIGSFSNGTVRKYHEGNLVFVGNTVNYNSFILRVDINNGFIYAAGGNNQDVKKYYESNLAFVGNTAAYGGTIQALTINNGFIYVGGPTDLTIKKYYESNLAFVDNTISYGGEIRDLITNNGFIYAGGLDNKVSNFTGTIQKFNESNLAFVDNTISYGGVIRALNCSNGFIYAGGTSNRTVQKFYESNLTFVGNTNNYGGTILSITTNNGFIYASGETNRTVQKFQEQGLTTSFDNQTFYTATKIKE
jgi:hypothetical protein